jgi:HEAT repeat protein
MMALRAGYRAHHTAVSDPIPSDFHRHRALLSMSVDILGLLILIAFLAWWLLPSWAPNFVIRYAPFSDMIFRAAVERGGSKYAAKKRLVAMGTGVVPAAIAKLQDQNQYVRGLAIDVLSDLKDPQAVEPLISMLTVPQGADWLKMGAISALGKIGDPRAIPPLLPFFFDKDLSEGAALAMWDLPDADVADALRPLIEQRQEVNVLMALSGNQDPRVPGWLDAEMRIEPPIITTNKDVPVWQDMAANMLGSCSLAGRDLLVKAMSDTSPALRKRGASGLIWSTCIPLSESQRAAVLHLLDDADPSVIEAAARACARHELKTAIPSLLRLLDHPDPIIRQAATHGFAGAVFDEAAITRLIALTTDPDEQVRIGAVKALGRIDDDATDQRLRVTPALIQALADGSHRVRKAALYGISFNQDPQVTARLVDLLDDPDEHVWRAAFGELSGHRRMLTDAQQTKVDAALAKISASPQPSTP